ncbi:MAG: cyclic peptide export ABC transporter, partial [Deltaproteobacteria bacterium]
MNVLLIMIRRSPLLFVLGTVVGAIGGAATTLLIGLLARIAFAQGESAAAVLGKTGLLCFVVVACGVISQQLLARLGQDAAVDMRVDLSRMILRMPLRDIEAVGKHTVLSVLSTDVATLTGTLPATPVIAVNLATVIACLVYLVAVSVRAVGIVIVFLLIGLVIFQMLQARSMVWYRKMIGNQTTLFKHVRAIAEGTKELKLSRARREGFIDRSIRPEAMGIRNNWLGANLFYVFGSMLGTLLHLTVTMLVLLLGRSVLHMDAASVGSFAIVLLYTIAPLQVVMGLLPSLGLASAAWGRIQGLEASARQTSPDAPGEGKISTEHPTIRLQSVAHTYRSDRDDSTFTLGPIDLEVRAGETLFIVGGNGSGKSTLGKLITGLYVPEGGRVDCNGKVVNDANREDFRQAFSTVFSDFFLFDEVAGAGPSAEQTARANEYLRDLHLDKKVKIENGVFSTLDLSTGQRKRLALLSA